MVKYSKAEKKIMVSAFCKINKLNIKNVEKDLRIREWIENAPVVIVEHDRILGNETVRDKERRMEMYSVYDGNIKELIRHLKGVFPEYKNLSKWELIINVCAKILNPDELIKQASTHEVFTDPHKDDSSTVVEENLTIQESSFVGSEASPVEESESVIEEVAATILDTELQTETTDNVDVATEEVDSTDANIPVMETDTVNIPTEDVEEVVSQEFVEDIAEVSNQEHVEEEVTVIAKHSEVQELPVATSEQTNSVEAQGTAKEIQKDSELNKEVNYKEDSKMSDTEDLLNAINNAKPSDATKPAETTSNVSAVAADSKEVLAKVADKFGKNQAAKNEWTIQNVVTGIISTMQPSALRVLSEVGVATKKEGDDAIADIKDKMEKFMCKVSGRNSITVEEFEALGDAAYDNVVVGETGKAAKAVAIAKETYKLYKQVYNDATVKLPIFIPSEDSLNYPIKGYMLGSTPMPTDEFIVEAMHSNGVVYGEGSVNEKGESVGEKPVAFTLGIATKKSNNTATGIGAKETPTKVLIVRPKNKKVFLQEANRITYLFTQTVADTKATANFKALVKVDGESFPANVSVWARENGNKVEKGKDTNGNITYKKIQAGLTLSAEVQKINNKSFEAKFVANENDDIIVTASRWNVNVSAEQQTGDFGNIKNFSQAPMAKVFAAIFSNEVSLTDTLKKSEIIKDIKAAANESAEAEAKESAEELS